MEVFFFVMQITHISEPNGAKNKNKNLSLQKRVWQMWSQNKTKKVLWAVNVCSSINIFSVHDVLGT